MNRMLMRLLYGIACSVALWPATTTMADEVSPHARKMITVKDGLSIVCEVRGQGDTALMFLHGWGGDRE